MSFSRYPGVRNWLLVAAVIMLLGFGLLLQYYIFQSAVSDYQTYMNSEGRAEYALVEKSVQSMVDSGKPLTLANIGAMLGPVQTCKVEWISDKSEEIAIHGENKPKPDFPSWFKKLTPLTPVVISHLIYRDQVFMGKLNIKFAAIAWRNHLWKVFLRQVAIFVSGVVVLFSVASWLVYRNISSLKELRCIISGISKMELGGHFQIPGKLSDELSDLVATVRQHFAHDLSLIINAVNVASDAVSICDPEGRAIFLNRSFQDLIGYTAHEINNLGGTASALASRTLIEKGYPVIKGGDHWSGEIEVFSKSGKSIPVFLRGNAIRDEAGKIIGLMAVMSDMSERKQAEQEMMQSQEELRELSDYLQTVREEEKANIAREIHDELGGLLTATKMDVFRINQKFGDTHPSLKDVLNSTLNLVDEAVRVTRRISTQLSPTVLEDLGLAAAIEWHVSEFQKRMGIQCQLILPSSELQVDERRSIALFRILQESLTNVARHAEATLVTIILQSVNQNVFLAIEDNGCGFDEAYMKKPFSHGLRGIRERARQFGGQADICSERGMGAAIMVYFPETTLIKE